MNEHDLTAWLCWALFWLGLVVFVLLVLCGGYLGEQIVRAM